MGLADLLNMQEDKGASAVLEALRALGVATYNYERQYYAFKEINVTAEALTRQINAALQRSLHE